MKWIIIYTTILMALIKKYQLHLIYKVMGCFILGGYGIPLYRYLIKRNINIKAIIDNRPIYEFPNDIFVISPDDVEPNSKIFIAVLNELSNFEIKEQIKDKDCCFLTYKELIYGVE